MRINSSGNLGIGTTSPLNPLHVVGAATFAGGVNASSLNVTGFSITDDSLVTLSDGSKKKIKDIKAGEKVLTLDEKTGKLVASKVNALLDHGIKPIYEMATESGKAINTTAEHPYLVKLYSKEECDKYKYTVWNKNADEFDSYCTRWVEVKNLKDNYEIAVPHLGNREELKSLNHISKKLNLNSNFNSSSMHLLVISNQSRISNFGTSYEYIVKAAGFSGSGNIYTLIENVTFVNDGSDALDKIGCIDAAILSPSEPRDHRCNFNNSDVWNDKLCFTIINFIHNGGSNVVKPDLILKKFVLLFAPGLDNSLYDNTAVNSLPHKSYFLSRIFLINLVGSISDLTLLPNASLSSSNDIASLLGFNSSIIECSSLSTFLSFSAINSTFINITAKAYKSGIYKDIVFEKIASIKTLEAQHVYDLSIEGTRNFIANDIVAHNTYLVTSSGNVGIGTTSPSVPLHVATGTGKGALLELQI